MPQTKERLTNLSNLLQALEQERAIAVKRMHEAEAEAQVLNGAIQALRDRAEKLGVHAAPAAHAPATAKQTQHAAAPVRRRRRTRKTDRNAFKNTLKLFKSMPQAKLTTEIVARQLKISSGAATMRISQLRGANKIVRVQRGVYQLAKSA